MLALAKGISLVAREAYGYVWLGTAVQQAQAGCWMRDQNLYSHQSFGLNEQLLQAFVRHLVIVVQPDFG